MCHASAQSLDILPACSRDILECIAHATKDTIALERLAWAVYDNKLGPGKSPILSGMESYGQVLRRLMDKAFQGLQIGCLVRMSAVFETIERREERVKSVVTVPQKPQRPKRYAMQ